MFISSNLEKLSFFWLELEDSIFRLAFEDLAFVELLIRLSITKNLEGSEGVVEFEIWKIFGISLSSKYSVGEK